MAEGSSPCMAVRNPTTGLNAEHVPKHDYSMMTDTQTTFRSSELSRSSAKVFAAASDHPVTVTRRDGEALVLMSQREDRARNELLEIAGQLIGAATMSDGNLTHFMTDHFPWMLALTPEAPATCSTPHEPASLSASPISRFRH